MSVDICIAHDMMIWTVRIIVVKSIACITLTIIVVVVESDDDK